jgi:hypothetical protein
METDVSPFTFLRSSSRRPVLALLVVGGVMTMSPVHAALSASAETEQNTSAETEQNTSAGVLSRASASTEAETGDGDILSAADAGGDLLGDLLGGDLLGGGLPTDDLLGAVLGSGLPTGDLLGGDLLGGGLPTDDLLGAVLGGGLPTGDLLGATGDLLGGGLPTGDLLGGDLLGGDLLGGSDDNDPPASSAGDPNSTGQPENGISIAGLHIGMKGHMNSLEELLDPCDSLTGRIHTGIQGADLLLRPALPARTSCSDPAPPVNNPGSPAGPPRRNPGQDVLAAAIDQPGPSRLVPAPQSAALSPTGADAAPGEVADPALAAAPGHRGALPRTGPGLPFQGPMALTLLGLSGALRAANGRRRPVLS